MILFWFEQLVITPITLGALYMQSEFGSGHIQ